MCCIESEVERIARYRKSASGDQLVGLLCIDTNPIALTKRNNTPGQKHQPHQTEKHTAPNNQLRLEELLLAYLGPIESRSKHGVEIKIGKRWDQAVRVEAYCLIPGARVMMRFMTLAVLAKVAKGGLKNQA